MAYTPEELALAVKVLKDFANNPDVGIVAELIRAIESKPATPAKEVRVVEEKETR